MPLQQPSTSTSNGGHSILKGNTTIYFAVCIGPDCGAMMAKWLVQWPRKMNKMIREMLEECKRNGRIPYKSIALAFALLNVAPIRHCPSEMNLQD